MPFVNDEDLHLKINPWKIRHNHDKQNADLERSAFRWHNVGLVKQFPSLLSLSLMLELEIRSAGNQKEKPDERSARARIAGTHSTGWSA